MVAQVILVVSLAVLASAAPWPQYTKHATHRVRSLPGNLQLTSYHPASTFKKFDVDTAALSKRQESDDGWQQVAMQFMANELGVPLAWRSGAAGQSDRANVGFMYQTHEGIPFANAVANVAVLGGQVVSYGSSFANFSNIAPSAPGITEEDALRTAEASLAGTKVADQPASLQYFVLDDGSAALTHSMQVRNQEAGTWYEAFVDAQTGKLVGVTDFVSQATYLAVPLENSSPLDGAGPGVISDPELAEASPQGWHNDGSTEFRTTQGNNVIAFQGAELAPESDPTQVFQFGLDLDSEPTENDNINAGITNAFFVANSFHDLTYLYGFTEDTFNFQIDNFGNGGTGNDAVSVSVQDASGVNNAQFTSPPDGQPGTMRMFLWDLTSPGRDGALENAIVIHENMHGVTSRMTGGGSGRCLQTTEAGGLGEGWSDMMADWISQTSANTQDFVVGSFVSGRPEGIRSAPYSTDPATNSLRFSSLQQFTEVHEIGEVWANILHNVYASLVDARGFSTTASTNPDGTEGNTVFLHLMMDALLLQPCNPTFIDARDAMLEADNIRYGGGNQCILETAFAGRGMGVNAVPFEDDTTLSAACQ